MEEGCSPKPRHKWSSQEQEILCLFSKLYENNISDVTKIINFVNAKELGTEGFQSGLPLTTVQAQWASIRRGSCDGKLWYQIITDLTIPEAKKRYSALRDVIEDAALNLGICLHLQTQRSNLIHNSNKDIRQKSSDSGSNDESDLVLTRVVSYLDATDPLPRTPRKRNRTFQSNESYLTPPTTRIRGRLPRQIHGRSAHGSLSSKSKVASAQTRPSDATRTRAKDDTQRNVARPVPELLYRWYCDESQGLNTSAQLRAGKYLKNQDIPSPVWDYKTVADHLTPRKITTPYISFRESIRACIYFALKANPATNPCVVVVDYGKVLAAGVEQWGNEDAIRASPELIEKFGLHLGRDRRYTGVGEWLVYGVVREEAIVSTFKITEFLDHVNRIPSMARILRLEIIKATSQGIFLSRRLRTDSEKIDRESGKAVGSLVRALNIPERFWKPFASRFAWSWKLRYVDGCSRKRFIDAVLGGANTVVAGDGDDDDNIAGFDDGEGEFRRLKRKMTAISITSGDEMDDSDVSCASSLSVELVETAQDQDLADEQLQVELGLSLQRENGSPSATNALEERKEAPGHSTDNRIWIYTPPPSPTPASRFHRPSTSTMLTLSQPHAVNSLTRDAPTNGTPKAQNNLASTSDQDQNRNMSSFMTTTAATAAATTAGANTTKKVSTNTSERLSSRPAVINLCDV